MFGQYQELAVDWKVHRRPGTSVLEHPLEEMIAAGRIMQDDLPRIAMHFPVALSGIRFHLSAHEIFDQLITALP
jgi:hypothetical protein